jgi:multidrug efflux pump subunit AcrB
MFEGAIRHGTLLAVGVLIVCIFGIVAAFRVPVQMIPDLEVRTISVRTKWPGATPQDVETEIVIEQEEYLRDIPSLRRMVSEATTGEATIELEFPFGVDINEALIRVNNALSQVPSYPENVDEPRLYTSSFSNNSFIFLRIEPLPGASVDMTMMRDFIDDQVRVRLERVPNVSEVSVRGGAERQVRIEVDAGRLAERGITLAALRQAIRGRNRDVSGGDLDSGKRRYLLRTVGRFADLDAIGETVIAERDGVFIRLKDVGRVRLSHFEERQRAYTNGRKVVVLSMRRETGSNVIAIMEDVLPVIDEINHEVLEPAGMQMVLTSEDVRYVRNSAANVWQNLAIGALLATGVMYLFLRSLPLTLIGVMGIPICTIAAFLGLLVTGRTINVISLAGVAFAIGMTLDNSIVVLEAIERERRRGRTAVDAALAGVRHVWPAVLASTMTTVLVFAPILFIREEAGQLYADVAVAISASILASMIIAITVLPAASARLPLSAGTGSTSAGGLSGGISRCIAWLIATRWRRLVCLGGTVTATASAILLLTPPAEYLPEGEEAKTFSVMIAPPGYNLTEMTGIADELNAYLVPFLDDSPAEFANGDKNVPALKNFLLLSEPQQIRVIAETKDPAQIDSLMVVLNERFRSYPGMRAFSSRGSIITSNDGGTRSVNVEVGGSELGAIYEAALAVYRRADQVFDAAQINSLPSSLSLGQPLIEIRPRWERAAEHGFTAQEIGYAVAALSDGAYVDEFYFGGDDKIDMFLYSSAGTSQTLENLGDLPIHTPRGAVVPLSAIADIVETVATDRVRRVDGRRTVTLNIIAPRSVALETAVQRVEDEVIAELRRSGAVPASISLDISGASDQLDATRQALSGNFLISLLLCYLLLVAIFTHWGYPLVIMMTVPLGIAGGIIGLWILNGIGAALLWVGLAGFPHQPFDMITMLGFLILLGTVVNNPILIVDEMRHRLSERGVDPRIAVRAAVDSRLRPVLMSTITTLFGLAPLVFLPGAGTELYRGLGAIVLFGLLFAMLVTLVFLPPLLVTLLELRPLLGRFAGVLGWRKGKGAPSRRDLLLDDSSPAERAGTGVRPHRRGGQP